MAEMTKDRRRDVDAQHWMEGPIEPNRPDRGDYPWGENSDEAVRILTELTGDFERFDAMIDEQRNILAGRAARLRRAGDIDRETERFKLKAAEMAMRTRRALDQLSHLAEPAKPHRRRGPEGGLAAEQRTG
jgi:hypothetical protein